MWLWFFFFFVFFVLPAPLDVRGADSSSSVVKF
jgi:hypothetical protein